MRRYAPLLVMTVLAASLLPVSSSAADDEATFPMTSTSTDVVVRFVDLGVDGDVELLGATLDRAFGGNVETTTVVPELDVVAATVTPVGLEALRSLGVVRRVEQDRDLELLLDVSVPSIDADDLHVAGRTGGGQAVVVVDTGVDATLPGIDVVAEACFVPEAPGDCQAETGPGAAAPCTDPGVACGHGSHIASIISANGGAFTGVAPDAEIIAIRVADDDAEISSLGVELALEHVLVLAGSHDIAAVNLSVGGDGSDCISPEWQDLVGRLGDAGIAVVAASGNLKPFEDWQDVPVDFPACLPGITAVGSTSESGAVSDFTQSDDTLELLAPGECIDSDRFDDPPGSCPTTSGTSFAAPHVAAAFALVAGFHSGFDPERTAQLLRTTGEFVTRLTPSAVDRDPRYAEIRLQRIIDFVPFADAGAGVFWNAASDWARFSGVSAGVDGIDFDAAGTLTRAQAVTLLWRFMGSPTGFAPAGFLDVPGASFYAPAVDWAKAVGVTTGFTATAFGPGEAVSRSQVAAFLWRMVGTPAGSGPAGFSDVDRAAFYAAAVDWMTANLITTGTTATTFSPDWIIDRGQIITFLHRLALAAGAWSGPVSPPGLVLF